MTETEIHNYHERVAARLRAVAATVTTPALKARLLKQVEEHDRLAQRVEEAELETAC